MDLHFSLFPSSRSAWLMVLKVVSINGDKKKKKGFGYFAFFFGDGHLNWSLKLCSITFFHQQMIKAFYIPIMNESQTERDEYPLSL